MDHLQRKYHVIDEELVLFNEEYYVSVLRVCVNGFEQSARLDVFNDLYAFSSNDIELEIDISEEEKGSWYLQLLVPYMLTLPETAKKRVQRGKEELQSFLVEKGLQLVAAPLKGEDIYKYIKRYNPNLVIT